MSGHSAQHAGLQKHSVGSIYPLAIVGVGDHWELHNLQTGVVARGGDGKVLRAKLPSTLLGLLSMGAVYFVTGPAVQSQRHGAATDPATRAPKPFPTTTTVTPQRRAEAARPGRWNWYDALDDSEASATTKPRLELEHTAALMLVTAMLLAAVDEVYRQH